MITIDKMSRIPIYEQIISRFSNLIALGLISPDSPLPSVRTLSMQLAINPNTLQRAYLEMERMGLCYSVAGSGRYVSKDARTSLVAMQQAELDKLKEYCWELCDSGIEKETILNYIKESLFGGQQK